MRWIEERRCERSREFDEMTRPSLVRARKVEFDAVKSAVLSNKHFDTFQGSPRAAALDITSSV